MTALGAAIEFLINLGFFDVVLPFLLIFTIVFGILEKTRIFGMEKVGGEMVPKKNLNAMVAFVIAFFTLAARNVVAMLQMSLPLVGLVLTIIVCFLLLAGSLIMKDGEFKLNETWIKALTVILFIAVLGIFFYSFGWLDFIIAYIMRPSVQSYVIPILLIIGIGLIVGWLISSPSTSGGEK